MKTVNKICQYLAAAASLAVIVLFFVDFAVIVSDKLGSLAFSGGQLAFGLDMTDPTVVMAKSSKILFVFLLSIITLACNAFGFGKKAKNVKYASAGFGLFAAIYMLVVALSEPAKFVDADPIRRVSKSVTIEYTGVVYVITAVLFVAAIAAIAHLLINDKIVSEQEKKPTIIKRVIQFFRDYKSEVKKIVWPSLNDVVKNTLIVLVICVIIGIFIWVVDFGLAELLDLILGSKA